MEDFRAPTLRDALRASPSDAYREFFRLQERLRDEGGGARSRELAQELWEVLPDLTYCADEYDCAKGADALVIVTEWEQFRALDLERMKAVMTGKPTLVDLRNIYPPEDVIRLGFVYESVGRAGDNGH